MAGQEPDLGPRTSDLGRLPPDVALQPLETYLREQVRIQATDPEQLQASVCFAADLQGPPDIAHGGAVTALLLELVRLHLEARGDCAGLADPIEVEVALHHALAVGRAARGLVRNADAGWESRLMLDDRVVAEAAVRPADRMPACPDAVMAAWVGAPRAGQLVPGYERCFGCGLQNPRGAQVRFEYDDRWMWREVAPPAHFRRADGAVAHGYLALLSDELGWWLGAIRQGECGLSNRLRLTLAAGHADRLLVLGPRELVTSRDARGRVWRAETFVLDPSGHTCATASVQFVGSPAFTKLMLPGFTLRDDAEALARAFPRYGAAR